YVLLAVALPEILHESNPAERRKLQDGRSHQNRDARAVFANQLFFKRRASSKPQSFLVRHLVQSNVLRRSEIGPMQMAGLQILAAVANQFEKRVVGLWDPVKLAGNDTRDSRFGRDRSEARPAAPQFLVPLVAIAEVAHDPG